MARATCTGTGACRNTPPYDGALSEGAKIEPINRVAEPAGAECAESGELKPGPGFGRVDERKIAHRGR